MLLFDYTTTRKRFVIFTCRYWVIPENIHTIPRAASWNSEGEGGFLALEFRRRGGGGVTQFGIPKAWGGVSALNSVNFQRKDSESSA